MQNIQRFFRENPHSFEILLLILVLIGAVVCYAHYFGKRPGGIALKIGYFLLSIMGSAGLVAIALFLIFTVGRLVLMFIIAVIKEYFGKK